MQLIAEAEGERRGLYGGAVGYLGYDGNLDTAITIRSAILKDDLIHMHVGAGIVARSVPEREFEETEHKAGAIRRAWRWRSRKRPVRREWHDNVPWLGRGHDPRLSPRLRPRGGVPMIS